MTPKQIKALRKSLGETTAEFGERFKRSGRTVEDWEQEGRRAKLDPLVLEKMQQLQKATSKRKMR